MRGSQRRRSGWTMAIVVLFAALLAIPFGGGIAILLHRGVMWGEERYLPMGEPPARLAQDVDTTFAVIGWFISFVTVVATIILLRFLLQRRTRRGTER